MHDEEANAHFPAGMFRHRLAIGPMEVLRPVARRSHRATRLDSLANLPS
jgi:hypothetical protein